MKATDTHSELTHARVRELLDYEPDTGWLIWKVQRPGKPAGTRAGYINGTPETCQGYREIWIGKRVYHAARLVVFWMTGEWPAETVDHINLDRTDDRWPNLRLATQQENCANRAMPKTNKSGFKGVSWCKGSSKWYASIKINGKSRNLGTYLNIQDAAAAYAEALAATFGAFARS